MLPKAYRTVFRVPKKPRRRLRRLRGFLRKQVTRRIKRQVRLTQRLIGTVQLVGFAQAVGFLVRRLRGEKAMALQIAGVPTPLWCRTSGSDRWALWQVFAKRHFEYALQDPPWLIVDGGANVGYASVYFANRYPEARIIAVEPDPENCSMFRKNCAAYPNVELIEGALWQAEAELVIENPGHHSWGFRVAEASTTPMDHSFRGVTVAGILARSPEQCIDLLKLDIEGSEEGLFSYGYEDWIGRIGNLMIETHGPGSRAVVFAVMQENGFSATQSGEYTIFEKNPVAQPGRI